MKEFLFPSSFIWDEDTYRENYGIIEIQPLERGYGVTLGNLYRRILLSSIPGISITSLKIDGVMHEFSTIEGVKEDVVEIVMNLKNVALKPVISEFPHKVEIEIEGKDEIVAGDLIPDGSAYVINSGLHIATVDPTKKYKMEIEITNGFGYLPVEKMKLMISTPPIGTILIDGIYSPIRKVSFHIENIMVGQSVDYEKLVLEIGTTGAITPKDAVSYATDLILSHLNLIKDKQTIGRKEVKKKEVRKIDIDIPISDLKLSTRVNNALTGKNIKTIRDLINTPREELEKLKN
ncbi:MAG TPA: DNA-directed RNA polymerase subunit alpha, partial [Candidatus Ratteibacteria bacterium]|nr:DNA-directed RNA polymerase subunit alpha [Candidatus Ratteibacteria bacterium]